MARTESGLRLLPIIAGLLTLAGATQVMPFLAPHDPLQLDPTGALAPPGASHWAGTDELGRDVFSRVLSAVATTVTVSILALISALGIGIVVGAIAGYFHRRWPDRLLMWVADVLTAIPFLILVAGILALWGGGLAKAYAVLSLVMWTNTARQVRGQIIVMMPLEWVASHRLSGLRESTILFKRVLPNCLGPALLFSFAYLPEVIGLEAGLSFLGLGVQPPDPGLGKMIFDGTAYIGSAWWICVGPALALALVVIAARRLVERRQVEEAGLPS